MANRKRVDARKPRKGESPQDVARGRIAQADREKATVLGLSGLGLRELPPEIGAYPSVSCVSMSSGAWWCSDGSDSDRTW